MSRRRRAVALGRLAGAYARHAVRRTLHPQGRLHGLAAFAALYGRDRITPVTAEERAGMAAHGLCIACGLCTFAALRRGYLTAERLPLQLSRSLPELWTARELDLEDLDWDAAAAVCPTGVPLPAVRDMVVARLERDGVLPPAPQRAPAELPVRTPPVETAPSPR